MNILYYVTGEGIYNFIKIWVNMQIICVDARPKYSKRVVWWAKVLSVTAITMLNVYNHFLCQVFYSSSMMLIIILMVSLTVKALYERPFRELFFISDCYWVILSLMDFAFQSAIYLVLEGNEERVRTAYMRESDQRTYYLWAFSLIILWTKDIMDKWLHKSYDIIKARVVLQLGILILSGGCIIYFQRIYLPVVTREYYWVWQAFFVLLLLAACGVLAWQRKANQRNLQLLKLEMLESNYQSLLELYREKAALLHDEKNHMNMLRQWAKVGDVEKITDYLEEVYDDLQNSRSRIWSNHPVLDLIFNNKVQEAEEHQIPLQIECDNCSGMNIKPTDLCSIFFNLIDNAMEASANIEEAGERQILMNCKRKDELLVVTMENTMKGMPLIENGRLKTNKKDRNLHGFGLYSVEKILNKYDGHIEYEIQGKKFKTVFFLRAFERGKLL